MLVSPVKWNPVIALPWKNVYPIDQNDGTSITAV